MLWGYIAYLKANIIKYSKGTLSLQKVKDSNAQCIKHMIKLAASPDETVDNFSFDKNRSKRSLTVTYNVDRMSDIPPEPVLERDFSASNVRNALFALKLDDYVVYYKPEDGTMDYQRIGRTASVYPSNRMPTKPIHIQLRLFRIKNVDMCFTIDPILPLIQVIRYLTAFCKATETRIKGVNHVNATPDDKVSFYEKLSSFIYTVHNDSKKDKGIDMINLAKLNFYNYKSLSGTIPLEDILDIPIYQMIHPKELKVNKENRPWELVIYPPYVQRKTIYFNKPSIEYLRTCIAESKHLHASDSRSISELVCSL